MVLGLNDAVTPAGSPVALSVTLPVKPNSGVTVMVDVPEVPWVMVNEDGDVPRVKLLVPVPLSVIPCDA